MEHRRFLNRLSFQRIERNYHDYVSVGVCRVCSYHDICCFESAAFNFQSAWIKEKQKSPPTSFYTIFYGCVIEDNPRT